MILSVYTVAEFNLHNGARNDALRKQVFNITFSGTEIKKKSFCLPGQRGDEVVEKLKKQEYDLAIIGCGPAGLSAAINAGIRNKNLILFGSELCSPKLHWSPRIDNYLGFHAITGEELRQHFLSHARAMGVEIHRLRVTNIFRNGDGFTILTRDGSVQAGAVIIATGVAVGRKLPGEEELIGRGVSYCATCDGPLYRGKKVAVLAHTREGEEEAEFLAAVADEVLYFPLYKDEMGPVGEKVQVIREKPVAVLGEDKVTGLKTDKTVRPVDGVFIIKEAYPFTQLMPELETEDGGIKVNRWMETNVPGVFAAGDCAGKPYQLSKAAGEGQVAAFRALAYLAARQRRGEV